MIETAYVFDREGRVIQFHTPEGRSAGSIPDTRSLWLTLQKYNKHLGGGSHKLSWEGPTGGVAHTHPWEGLAAPSRTDVTTFSAVELGLGQRLLWPVVTFTHIAFCVWAGPEPYDYVALGHCPFAGDALSNFAAGIERLRELSR